MRKRKAYPSATLLRNADPDSAYIWASIKAISRRNSGPRCLTRQQRKAWKGWAKHGGFAEDDRYTEETK